MLSEAFLQLTGTLEELPGRGASGQREKHVIRSRQGQVHALSKIVPDYMLLRGQWGSREARGRVRRLRCARAGGTCADVRKHASQESQSASLVPKRARDGLPPPPHTGSTATVS